MPVTWIRANASAPVRWRTLNEVLPPGSATDEDRLSLREESLAYKEVTQITRKQKEGGTWGGNMLGLGPDKSLGVRGVGTVATYRRLVELGVPDDFHPVTRTNRTFFRILSRDPDFKLHFEYEKLSKKDPAVAEWSRSLLQEGVVASLVQSGHGDDPRVRGAAHRMATNVSQFLRSDAVEDPFEQVGSKTVLRQDAHLPTVFTVAMVAFMTSMQRERAGFTERLVQYLTQPPPDGHYSIAVGEATLKPMYHLVGDPLLIDASGKPADIPFALHWIEMLTRMGMLEASTTALQALNHLLADCNDQGVWDPKNLRGFPKSTSGLADHAFPLEPDAKKVEARKVDVTFRLALIAKLAGWELEFT